jgi:hypothetical protein
MSLSPDQRRELSLRVARYKVMYERSDPGDLLVLSPREGRYPSLEGYLCGQLYKQGPERVLEPRVLMPLIEQYVGRMRSSFPALFEWDDDVIPSAIVYWGIGGITAAMTGLEPMHEETTSWLEPSLEWGAIEELRFDEDNRWVQFALNINRALWRCWEEDFFVLPFLHRSPLDAANGIRGTELFIDMYVDPTRVNTLTEWCTDWSIEIESFLCHHDGRSKGWGTGVWDVWLPEGTVFVNGDPVGLVSREMMREFEQPYTEKLFTRCGGGFFHNHSVGLYQVDQVAQTGGLLVQAFVDDPKGLTVAEVLLGDDDSLRDRVLEASLLKPIQFPVMPYDVEALLEVVKHGRFLLWIMGDDDPTDTIRKVRRTSNLG